MSGISAGPCGLHPSSSWVSALDVGLSGRQCCGGRVRAGEADDLIPCFEEFADDRRSDVSGRAGDKHAHGQLLFDGDSIALCVLLVDGRPAGGVRHQAEARCLIVGVSLRAPRRVSQIPVKGGPDRATLGGCRGPKLCVWQRAM
jgi:hypothetical protein